MQGTELPEWDPVWRIPQHFKLSGHTVGNSPVRGATAGLQWVQQPLISPGHLGMGVLRTQGRHTWGTQLCMGELLLLCHSSVEPKTTALTQGPTWSQAGNTNVPSIQQKGMHLVCLYTSRNAVPFNPQIKEKKITLIPVTWMPVFWKGNIFWFTVTHNKVIRYWKGSLLTLLQKSCQKPQNQIWKHNVSLFTWQHFECCETLKDLAQFWPNNLCFHRIK